MASRNYFFTSESVTEGHPDKVCDNVSDAVLDALLADDPHSRVACETATKSNMILLFGEVTIPVKDNATEKRVEERKEILEMRRKAEIELHKQKQEQQMKDALS